MYSEFVNFADFGFVVKYRKILINNDSHSSVTTHESLGKVIYGRSGIPCSLAALGTHLANERHWV